MTASAAPVPTSVPVPGEALGRLGGALPVEQAPAAGRAREIGTTWKAATVTLAGGAFVVAGSLLPWFVARTASAYPETLTIYGVDAGRDGLLTLVAGIVLVTVGVTRIFSSRPWAIVFPIQLVAATFAGFVAMMNIIEFFRRFTGYSAPSLPWTYFDLHAGLWVLAAGAFMSTGPVFTSSVFGTGGRRDRSGTPDCNRGAGSTGRDSPGCRSDRGV